MAADGTLTLQRVEAKDAGLYVCQDDRLLTSSEELVDVRTVARVRLHVKSKPPPPKKKHPKTRIFDVGCLVFFWLSATPPAPVDVQVHPSDVLALVVWRLDGTGGYPTTRVQLVYQKLTADPDNPSWRRTYPEHLPPDAVRSFRLLSPHWLLMTSLKRRGIQD